MGGSNYVLMAHIPKTAKVTVPMICKYEANVSLDVI